MRDRPRFAINTPKFSGVDDILDRFPDGWGKVNGKWFRYTATEPKPAKPQVQHSYRLEVTVQPPLIFPGLTWSLVHRLAQMFNRTTGRPGEQVFIYPEATANDAS